MLQILRVSRALTCEPCSDRDRRPYRRRRRFRHLHRGHDLLLGLHPDGRNLELHPERRLGRHLGEVLRSLDERRNLRHPDEVRLHLQGEGHLGDQRRLGLHPDEVHLLGAGYLDGPCPVKEQKDYCPDVRPDVECPCPVQTQMDYCQGVECQGLLMVPGWLKLGLEQLEQQLMD